MRSPTTHPADNHRPELASGQLRAEVLKSLTDRQEELVARVAKAPDRPRWRPATARTSCPTGWTTTASTAAGSWRRYWWPAGSPPPTPCWAPATAPVRSRSAPPGRATAPSSRSPTPGPGAPADLQRRIFKPFFTTGPVGQVTGLGLDVSWRIVVKRHRGDLRVSSTPCDTRFQVRIPIDAGEA